MKRTSKNTNAYRTAYYIFHRSTIVFFYIKISLTMHGHLFNLFIISKMP